MAKKSGNLLIKVAVLIALVAAVFFALDSWRKQSTGDQATGTATPGDAKPGLSRAEAERIGNEIGTRIGTEIGTRIGREVAAQMLAERQAELAVADADPSAAEPAPPPPAPEPAPIPEQTPPAETAAAPEPEPQESPAEAVSAGTDRPPAEPGSSDTRTQGTIPGTPIAQPTAGRDTWWTQSNTAEADALVLTYAGNFKSTDSSQSGIALMFSGRFDQQTDFASSISVTGGNVSGEWRLGANAGLIYLPGVPSGNYTVTVKAGLTDADGKTFKKDVSGPVEVQ